MGSSAFKFQPIAVNANAPRGNCILGVPCLALSPALGAFVLAGARSATPLYSNPWRVAIYV
jgi:hypothetical protein